MLFCNLPSLLTEWALAQSFPFLLIQKPYQHKLLFTAASKKDADARLIHEGHHHWAFFFFPPFRKPRRNSSDYIAQIQYSWTSWADRKVPKLCFICGEVGAILIQSFKQKLGNKWWAWAELKSAMCMLLKLVIL